MNPTNFEKVFDFNVKFGVPTSTTPQPELLVTNPSLIKLRMDLIREEMKELEQAYKDNNFVEVIDALSDILYVVYGFGCTIGVDMDKAFDLVHQSNMSKLCKTEDEAKETVKWYENEYINNRQPYDSPDYRLSDDGSYYVVFNKSTGKILKSINYNVVDLTCFAKN